MTTNLETFEDVYARAANSPMRAVDGRDHLEVRLPVQQSGESVTNQAIVLDHHHQNLFGH